MRIELPAYSPARLPQLRVLGRTGPAREPVTLFWTASGLELLTTGGELWLGLNAGYDAYEPWLSVELNGAWISRFPVAPGRSEVCIFRGMTPGRARRVRILKDVQAMSEDPAHLLQVTALRTDGEFLPLPAPSLRLEFVGDSITSGEGALGAVCEEDWVSAFFSAENHYGRMTADALGAEYRVVSQSGWGLLSGWDNDPRHRLLPYYRQVCGLAAGAQNAAAGAQQPYDFAAWPADAVVVNLGTNDACALHNPPWRDPQTGEAFAQTADAPHLARLEQSAVDGLRLLRAYNPQALLVWAYGMLGDELRPVLEAAVTRYRCESGDTRAWFLPLPDTTPETVGAREHPGAAVHRRAAAVLTDFLREKLL